jgi:PAS domain S-box-containing protein
MTASRAPCLPRQSFASRSSSYLDGGANQVQTTRAGGSIQILATRIRRFQFGALRIQQSRPLMLLPRIQWAFSRAKPLASLEVEMHSDNPRTARAHGNEDAQTHPSPTDRFREFEPVLENLEEMIVVVNRDYRILMANRAYLNFRRIRREQVVGCLVHEVVRPEVFERELKPRLDQCLQNHIVKFEMTCSYPHLGERNLFVSYFPIVGSSGVERVASVLQDITERKRAHELIRQERDRAQSYLDIADVILLALDLQGRITLINRKGCAMLGCEESELLGRDWVDTCLPARIRDELRACFRGLLGGNQTSIENPVVTSSGEERMIAWRNSVLRDGAGQVIGTLSSGEDITERKKFESALRRLSGRLLQAQDDERRKVARELHDGIGTYVSGLSLALGKIRTFLDETNPEHRRALSECRELIQAAGGEIRSISYLLYPPTIEALGLESAIEWLVRGFSSRSGIIISLQLATDLGRLKAETELTLFRVTQEALNNVYRHSGSSTAAVRLFRESENVVLEIADQGQGMRPLPVGSTPEFTVGISGMRERVEDVGGKFSVESVPGEGCTVRAALPLASKS